jgi:glucan-binding YG repeat protein
MNRKQKRNRWRLLSMLLAVVLLMGLMPATVLADENVDVLWVNGVDIVAADNNTVACGNGTAVYDRAAGTLTLTDAVIDGQMHNAGISRLSSNKPLNIVLKGKNSIVSNSADDSGKLRIGIYTKGSVNISGEGVLEITTEAFGNDLSGGIYAYSGLLIADTTVELKNATAGMGSYGIDVNNSNEIGFCKFSNANVTITDFEIGINNPAADISIMDGSIVNIVSQGNGIVGGIGPQYLIKDSTVNVSSTQVAFLTGNLIDIQNSNIEANSSDSNAFYTDGGISIGDGSEILASGYYPALYAVDEIDISGGNIKASADADAAIFTPGNINITGGTINASGYWPALNAVNEIAISGGDIEASAAADAAIFTQGNISITGGAVHAKGADGYAAILTKSLKASDETPAGISLSDVWDINGGKVSVSDVWESDGQEYYWTSFIEKEDSGNLADDNSNALQEVTIQYAEADYSELDSVLEKVPADLNIYTDKSVQPLKAAIDAVVRGLDMGEQDAVDGFAEDIENAIAGLELKPEYDKGEWKYENSGWRYKYRDGSYPVSQWKYIDENWFYFDSEGYRTRGWQKVGGVWYYMLPDGPMATGWLRDGNAWYYLKNSGAMATGWLLDGGTWYYLESNGKMATGWLLDRDIWYYLKGNGAMQTGWLRDGNAWYYLKSSGGMATGWQLDKDTWYYLKQNGEMVTGWLLKGDNWYYLKGDGAMQTGWLKQGNIWYYLKSNGKMATGWQLDGDTWYYLKSNGKMATGWLKQGNTWYYLKGSGEMQTGWLKQGNTWYYLKGDGKMATGWYLSGETWYYFYRSGAMAANKWIDGYYVGKNGAMH